MGIKKYCNRDYIFVCVFEGRAEEDRIEWLIVEDKLIFSEENLIKTRNRQAKKIEKNILSYDHDKPIVVFRIIDSEKEKFALNYLLKDEVSVENFITNPEIEILMIIDRSDFDKYSRKFKNKNKPILYH